MTAGLAEDERGAGTRVAYPYEPRPERVALDLALQAAGCIAVPVGPGEVDIPVDDRELWRADSAGPGAGGRLPWGGSLAREAARGGVVAAGRLVEADELVARAVRFEEQLAAAVAQRPDREIVVSAGPLADPAERDLLAWATLTGAAVVLEPAAERLVDSAVWARPTVFLGTAEEADRLLDRADAADREGWAGFGKRLRRLAGRPAVPGRPLGRLHTLFVRGTERQAPELADRARARGVAVLSPLA